MNVVPSRDRGARERFVLNRRRRNWMASGHRAVAACRRHLQRVPPRPRGRADRVHEGTRRGSGSPRTASVFPLILRSGGVERPFVLPLRLSSTPPQVIGFPVTVGFSEGSVVLFSLVVASLCRRLSPVAVFVTIYLPDSDASRNRAASCGWWVFRLHLGDDRNHCPPVGCRAPQAPRVHRGRRPPQSALEGFWNQWGNVFITSVAEGSVDCRQCTT
jgi:hypothetical protein